MTRDLENEKRRRLNLVVHSEARMAFENQEVSLHAVVDFRHDDGTWLQDTTVGRIFFNEILPQEVRFINELFG